MAVHATTSISLPLKYILHLNVTLLRYLLKTYLVQWPYQVNIRAKHTYKQTNK